MLARHREILSIMGSDVSSDKESFVKLSRELSELSPIVEEILSLQAASSELKSLEELIADPNADREITELAEIEYRGLKKSIPLLKKKVEMSLIPKEKVDTKNVILEIRAGTGGDEAALFASDLFRMYQRYAEKKGWAIEVLSLSEIGIGGIKEIIVSVTGKNVFSKLKYESGVHRVQRIPTTESGGRIHTSAATVAVMPEAEEVDIKIDDKDLRIDVFRASGPGGQSVNTTDSAVRITHLPTGVSVSQQDEKSQHKNKAKAMRVLRARLYDRERDQMAAERAEARRSQVGSGDRSERIRTYNFPDKRITDHRIGLTLHKLDSILEGEMDSVIERLTAEDQAQKLAQIS